MSASVITQICDHFGGQSALAKKLGVSAPTVNEWVAKDRKVPEARCPELERLSDGKYACEVIRPDVPWHRVPDRAWAWNVRGRPVIDVTRDTEPAQEITAPASKAGRTAGAPRKARPPSAATRSTA